MIKRFLFLILVLTVCAAGGAYAHSPAPGHDDFHGYILGGNGHPALSGNGLCMRGAAWTEGDLNRECEGLEPEPEPAPAPEPEPQVETAPAPEPEPEPEPEKVLRSLTLEGGALFDTASANLTVAGDAALREFVNDLSRFQKVSRIEIGGHADSRGNDDYNMALSERRANSVRDRLVSMGVNPAVLRTQGHGETQPVADNNTKSGRAQNRRVELQVVGLE